MCDSSSTQTTTHRLRANEHSSGSAATGPPIGEAGPDAPEAGQPSTSRFVSLLRSLPLSDRPGVPQCSWYAPVSDAVSTRSGTRIRTREYEASVSRGLPAGFAIPNVLQNVAQTFVVLQEQRHLGDYDLSQNFTRSDVLALVQQADQARIQFQQITDLTIKKFFLACLMTWKVLGNRN